MNYNYNNNKHKFLIIIILRINYIYYYWIYFGFPCLKNKYPHNIQHEDDMGSNPSFRETQTDRILLFSSCIDK